MDRRLGLLVRSELPRELREGGRTEGGSDGCSCTGQDFALAWVRKGSGKFMGKSIWVDGLSQWMGWDATATANAFWSNVHTPQRISCRPAHTDTREPI